jgi:predicted MPP superfamily phosphohydrolase
MHPLTSMLIFGAAGFCIFLVLLNRALILRRCSRRKAPIIILAFVALVGGGPVVGLFLAGSPWVAVPIVVLGLVVIGEVRRLLLRRSVTASPPVESTPRRGKRASLITTTDLVVHRYEVPHARWNGERLRIVQLTDLHVQPAIPLEYYREAVALALAAEPDLIFLTGDYLDGANTLPGLREVLGPLAGREVFAVLGNHDYWPDPVGVREVLRDCEIRLLSDESLVHPVAGQKVAITGYDYHWGPMGPGLASPDDALLHIVLAHSPDNIYRIAEASGDLVFSGHFHAGQVRIPLIGPIVIPSIHGRLLDRGHYVVNGTHLFVSSGIGPVTLPVRIACRPDILVVDVLPGRM